MTDARRNTAARFDGLADDYARYRPSYPDGVCDLLTNELCLGAGDVVCDLGSGTGIFAELCLDRGLNVFAVEPNRDMRSIAHGRLGERSGFAAIDGSAEATTLPDDHVDVVTAAQAFHWFEPSATAREARRIGRSGVRGLVVWNARRHSGSAFLAAYEAFLRRWGTDYTRIADLYGDADALSRFFGGTYTRRVFTLTQTLDLAGLRGRLRSVSYVPSVGHERHAPMMEALSELFEAHAEGGRVRIEYDTVACYGPLA